MATSIVAAVVASSSVTATTRSSSQGLAKKKRPPVAKRSRADAFVDDRQSYYDRLLHQCRKDLHKHAKVTKTFETQKLIRKIKEHKKGNNNRVDESDDKDAVLAKQEIKLQQLKGFGLEPVIQEAIRRLGLLQLDPKLQPQLSNMQTGESKLDEADASSVLVHVTLPIEGEEHEGDGSVELNSAVVDSTAAASSRHNNVQDEPNDERRKEATPDNTAAASTNDSSSNSSNSNTEWISARLLQHKNMCVALEHWNDQITEYRRWSLRQQERLEVGGVVDALAERQAKKGSKKGKSSKSTTSQQQHSSNPLINGGSASMFVTLGGGDDNTDATNDDPLGYYGPAGGGGAAASGEKRNRQGQRARRAKAAAVEAKKQGRVLRPEESLNWRQPKSAATAQTNGDGLPHSKSRHSNERKHGHSTMGGSQGRTVAAAAEPTPPESLHPSWQARKEQKDGIVAFQGKKITFD